MANQKSSGTNRVSGFKPLVSNSIPGGPQLCTVSSNTNQTHLIQLISLSNLVTCFFLVIFSPLIFLHSCFFISRSLVFVSGLLFSHPIFSHSSLSYLLVWLWSTVPVAVSAVCVCVCVFERAAYLCENIRPACEDCVCVCEGVSSAPGCHTQRPYALMKPGSGLCVCVCVCVCVTVCEGREQLIGGAASAACD